MLMRGEMRVWWTCWKDYGRNGIIWETSRRGVETEGWGRRGKKEGLRGAGVEKRRGGGAGFGYERGKFYWDFNIYLIPYP